MKSASTKVFSCRTRRLLQPLALSLSLSCLFLSVTFVTITATASPAVAQSGKVIFSKKIPEVSIEIMEISPTQFDVVLGGLKAKKQQLGEAEIQFIKNPSRLVIDIKGAQLNKNQTFSVGHTVVKAARLGVHPDHLRLVLDLAADDVVPSAPHKGSANSYSASFVLGDEPPKAPEAVTPKKSSIQTAVATSTPVPSKTIATTATEAPTKAVATKALSVEATATPVPPTSMPTVTATKEVATTPVSIPTPAVIEIEEETVAPTPVKTVAEAKPSPQKTATKTASPEPTATPRATKTPAATKTPTPTKTSTATRTKAITSTPTSRPTLEKSAPLSALLENKDAVEKGAPTNLGEVEPSVGPTDATQYLMDLRFDYQIQNHEPLLRLVMMSGANFNLVKKDAQTYELLIPKAGIKLKSLAQPHFPPHDFVGFTLVHPKYQRDTLTVEIKVDRGARITAFARGNEIWIRSATK